MTSAVVPSPLVPYVPRTLLGWDPAGPHFRTVEGSLVSADISGFTALSERLAGYGREGAEELTVLLNRCFGGMIEIVDSYGGDVLKFGGDALLILFTGDHHTERAAAACYEMRALIQKRWSTPLVSRVELGISQGIHSGEFSLHLVHAGYHELWVVGPGMSAAVGCEGAANRGEILLSHEAAERLNPSVLGESVAEGRPLMRAIEAPTALSSTAVDADRVGAYVPAWLAEQVEAAGVSEHRAVTVGFAFFGGVDDVLAAEGEEGLHARLQHLADVVSDAMDRYGTYWLASDVYPGGGKIIVTAGAPRSAGDDEDAAVRALRTVLDADVGLPLRMGVNRGHVFMGDLGSGSRRTFTVMGDAVNLAARLMQKSRPGELVASATVLDLVPSKVVSRPLEPFLVKGKSEPIHASVVDSVGDTAAQDAASAPGVPFVGRDAQMALLDTVVDDARRGRGGVVDLVGEPGIGKSRLVTEITARNPDLDVLPARGGRYARRSPYFAVRATLRRLCGVDMSTPAAAAGAALEEWVRQVDPALLEWLPLIAIPFDADVAMTPTVERIGMANRAQKVRESVGDLLEAVLAKPTLLVVDDAQWLDEASDQLFAHLAIRSRDLPWLIVALRRTDTECFASQYRHSHPIQLGELSRDATRELTAAAVDAGLGSTPEQIEDLLARGATNPLFILELVRAGAAAGASTPDSIEALVTTRIDTLAASDRIMLREGAVLGSVIDTALLAEATGDRALGDALRWRPLASFLDQESPGVFRFSHALYREVAYEGLSFRRRQSLHRSIGVVLEHRAGDAWAEASELLSLHFHAARDWDRSWKYSVTAGERARGKYANVEAANFFARALSGPRRAWPSRSAAASVAEALGDVLELTGRFDDADDAFRFARRLVAEPAGEVRLLRKRGVLRERQGQYAQALRWYTRGLNKAKQQNLDLAAEGDLCIAYAGVRFRQGDTPGCIVWAHRAEGIANRISDRRLLAHASYLLMIGYSVLRRPEAMRYRDISLPLFEADGDLIGQANVLNNLGVDAKEEGRWAEALDFYERSRVAREQAGDVIGAATATNNIGEILLDQGRFDEAEPLFREALLAWRRANYPVGVALATSYLGRLQMRRGDLESACSLLAEARERFEAINAGYFIAETMIYAVEAEALAGHTVLAEAIDDLEDRVRKSGDPLLEAMMTRVRARAALRRGEPQEAIVLAARAAEIADQIGSVFDTAKALDLRAKALVEMGQDGRQDADRAEQLFSSLGVVVRD